MRILLAPVERHVIIDLQVVWYTNTIPDAP